MAEIYVTTATLTNKRTLILDEALPRIPTRVRVTIEELPKTQRGVSFLLKLQRIHHALIASGHQPRSKEAIDAQIRAERDSWGE